MSNTAPKPQTDHVVSHCAETTKLGFDLCMELTQNLERVECTRIAVMRYIHCEAFQTNTKAQAQAQAQPQAKTSEKK